MRKKLTILTIVSCMFLSAQTYQWAKAIGGISTGNLTNNGRFVSTDQAGNAYITGNFQGTNVDFNPGFSPILLTSNLTNIFFAKYSAAGTCLWAKSFSGAGGVGQCVKSDASNNVYITGNYYGTAIDFDPGPGTATLSSAGLDIFIAKYDAAGNYLWAKGIGGASTDEGLSLDFDASGNLLVLGRFQGTAVDFDPGPGTALLNSGGNYDIFIAKYDVGGNYLWAKSIGGGGSDVGNSISTDLAGNSYITGIFTGSSVDFDPGPGVALLSATGSGIYFAKYDINGNYVWAKSISGSVNGVGFSIKTDPFGNFNATGTFQGTNVDFDPGPGLALLTPGSSASGMFFAKYDNNGNYVWAKALGGVYGQSITRNTAGKVYITGQFNGAALDFDPGPGTATLSSTTNGNIFVAKYDAAGNYLWAKPIIGTSSSTYGNSVAVDGSDNMFICGGLIGANVDFDLGPGTATLNASNSWNLYLAKYSSCGQQVTNPRSICAGASYVINGHNYTVNGNYSDTLITTQGCDSIVVTQLTVSTQTVNVTISSASVLCSGSSNTLSASGALTYTWNTGPQTPVLLVTPTSTTQYIVVGTGTSGCIGSDTINVLQSPTIIFRGKQIICKGEQVTIIANGASTYTWNTGAQTPSISASLNTTTIYSVTGISNTTQCKSQQTYTVKVFPCTNIASYSPGTIEMTIYPNPATTELYYTVNAIGSHKFIITDNNGTIVAEGEKSGAKVRLDLTNLKSGIYNLTLLLGKISKTSRFVIE